MHRRIRRVSFRSACVDTSRHSAARQPASKGPLVPAVLMLLLALILFALGGSSPFVWRTDSPASGFLFPGQHYALAVSVNTSNSSALSAYNGTVEPPIFPQLAVLDATMSSINVTIGRWNRTCFNASVQTYSNVSFVVEETVDIYNATLGANESVILNVTKYRSVADPPIVVVPTTCADKGTWVMVRAIVPFATCTLNWYTNASRNASRFAVNDGVLGLVDGGPWNGTLFENYTFYTNVTVTRRTDIPLPIAAHSLSYYDSVGSVDVTQIVPNAEVPLHNMTTFHWSYLPATAPHCGLDGGRRLNDSLVRSVVVGEPSNSTPQLLIRWSTTCAVRATLIANTSYHGRDPYYSFAPVTVDVRQCYANLTHPPVIYLGAALPDYFNFSSPTDLPTGSAVSVTMVLSQTVSGQVSTIVTPQQFMFNTTQTFQRIAMTGVALEPFNRLNATMTGTPSRCLLRIVGPTSYKVANRTFLSVQLQREQNYFTEAPVTFLISTQYLLDSRVMLRCKAPATTVQPAVFEPMLTFSANLVCSSQTNGSITFAFEVDQSSTVDWRAFATSPSSIRIDDLRRAIGAKVDMFDPAVLLYGEGAGVDAQNTFYVSLTRGSDMSASVVVTLTPSATLGLSQSVLVWSAGESARKAVVVRTVEDGTNGTVGVSLASYDGSGHPTAETAGGVVSPSQQLVIAINSKAPIYAAWSPNWGSLTQGRALEVVYRVSSPPIGELRITPSGTALRYISVSPTFLIINSTQTVARATVMPLVATPTNLPALLNVTLNGTAAAQFIISSITTLDVTVRRRLQIRSSMPSSLLSNAAETFTFDLEEPPLAGTVLTVTLACLLDGISQMIFSPFVFSWTADSSSVVSVRSSAVFETGTSGVNCTGTLSGNATGFEPFLRNVAIRNPQPFIFTYQSSLAFPEESARVTVNTQFTVASPVYIHATCRWIDDGNVTAGPVGGRYDDPLAGVEGADPMSCDHYLDQQIVTVPRDDPSSVVVFVGVRVPEAIDRLRAVQVTLVLVTSATDMVLPPDNTTTGVMWMRPRRWVTVRGLPDLIFGGDTTTILAEIEAVPDNTERLYLTIDGNPSIEWDRSSVRARNVTLMLPARSGVLSVALSATSLTQVNRYDLLNTSLQINLYPKISISVTAVKTPQVVGDLNAQSFTVAFSRLPLLRGCDLVPSYASSTNSLVSFTPSLLYWGVTDSPLSRLITIVGLSPGLATEVVVVPDCNPREVDARSTRVTVASNFKTIPLKTITLSTNTANLTRIIAGTLNSEVLIVRLSDAPSEGSILVLDFAFSDPTVAIITPTRLNFTSGVQQQVVQLIGIAKGQGSVVTTVVDGNEYVRSVTGFSSISVIDTISVNVYLQGESALEEAEIESDTWSDWEISISDFVPNYSPTFEVTATAIDPTINTLINLSTSRITIATPPVAYPFRLAAAGFQPTTIILSIAAPQRPEFKDVNNFNVAVVPVPSVNISGVPTVLTIGARNTRTATIGVFSAPSDVLGVVLDTSKCNASVATVTAQSVLQWTPEVFGSVGIIFAGVGEGLCEVVVAKSSSIFGKQIVYIRRQFQVYMPPVIDAVNSTRSVQAQKNEKSALDSLIGSVSGGAQSATEEVYTGAGHGDNITFTFKVLRDERGTVGVTAANGTFPVNRTRLSVVAYNAGSGQEPTGYDIVIECTAPREGEVGLVEVLEEGSGEIDAIVINSALVEIGIGPLPGLLIMADQILTVSFSASAFLENAYPSEAHDSFPVVLQRYQPNIVTATDRIVLQVAGNLGVLAAAFGAPIAVMTAVQFYQSTWLYDCPRQDSSELELPFGITINRYDSNGVDNAVVVCACFVAVAAMFGGFHLILVSGFYLQRSEYSERTFAELSGRFRFPGVTFIAFFYVVQFSAHYAMIAVFSSENIGHRVGAFILLVVPFATILIVIHGVVWRGQSLTFLPADVVYRDKLEKRRKKMMAQRRIIHQGENGQEREGASLWERLQRAFRIQGYWVHPTNGYYVQRWGVLFVDATGTYKWLSLVYYILGIALGCLSGYEPSTNAGCVGRTATAAAIFGLLATAIFFWRPFQFRFMSFILFVVHAFQFIAHTILAAELRSDVRNDALQLTSLRLLIAADVILFFGLVIRAVMGCFTRMPPRAELLRTCEELGISTVALDFTQELLRSEDGTAVIPPSAMATAKGAQGVNFFDDDEDADDGGGGAAASARLQKALLTAPTRVNDDDFNDADVFASGYPHNEDPDLYGQYAPMYVADQLRGDEQAFSPLRRAELRKRQLLTRRRHMEEELNGDGEEMWITDVASRIGHAPLTASRLHPSHRRDNGSSRQITFDDDDFSLALGQGGGGAYDPSYFSGSGGDVTLNSTNLGGGTSHQRNPYANTAANSGANPYAPEAGRRMTEKPYGQHAMRGKH